MIARTPETPDAENDEPAHRLLHRTGKVSHTLNDPEPIRHADLNPRENPEKPDRQQHLQIGEVCECDDRN